MGCAASSSAISRAEFKHLVERCGPARVWPETSSRAGRTSRHSAATLERRPGVLVFAEAVGGSASQNSGSRAAVWGIIMPAVRLQASSLAEAEELVRRVWRVLEEHNIATPKLLVTEGVGVTTIELLFAS